MKNIQSQLHKDVYRYLQHLQLEVESPSYDYLSRICHAHLNTFPFENISKLLFYKEGKGIPALNPFLDNYQKYNFGGTCYALNSNLLLLFKELGYECYHVMLGGVHIGIIVVINHIRYYVDCGAAAPMFTPVDFENDLLNSTQFGEDCIKILPENPEKHEYKYVRFSKGVQSGDGWAFNSARKYEFSDYSEIIRKSNQAGSDFMEILRCQIWQSERNRSVSLVNNKFTIRYASGETTTNVLGSINEIKKVITDEFLLPNLPVEDAIAVLRDLDIDIFEEKSE